jgi:hypothetical protein
MINAVTSTIVRATPSMCQHGYAIQERFVSVVFMLTTMPRRG